MTATLNPVPAPAASFKLGPPKSDPIDFRSAMIGRLAARMSEIPSNVVRHLSLPHIPTECNQSTNKVAGLIGELIAASSKNEPLAHPSSPESDQSISYSLAISLQWLFEMDREFGNSLRSRLVLKTLMPLYLAAGQGRRGTSTRDTVTMIRTACMLPELNRLTSDDDLSIWVREHVPANTEPIESISKSFRVDLALMADSFWRQATSRHSETSAASSRGFEVSVLSADKQRSWWSLAGQLCAQRAQIIIPADLAVGVIAWEKLLDHWQRISKAIMGQTNGNNIVEKTFPSGPTGSCQLETKRVQVSSESKMLQENRIANDHRFVEIRSGRDPQLSSNLDQILQHCKNEQGTMALIVAKRLANERENHAQGFENWQSRFIELMDAHGESTNVRGFISGDGELSLVFQDVDRAELGQWIRDSFAKINLANEDSSVATAVALPLVAGVAMVNAPSRSFKIDQLIHAAWRCLDGASKQGAGAVKTIEVY